MEPNLHTFVVSDMHLTEAEDSDPGRPFWMAYKRREFFIDEDFARFLSHAEQKAGGPIELLLNGDIFDFDSVTSVPSKDRRVEWLERARGLGSEEWKSQYKMQVIIDDHPRWFEALGQFIARGNRAVFVIGNHDVELYWPSVQRMICDALGAALPSSIGEEEDDDPIVFCNSVLPERRRYLRQPRSPIRPQLCRARPHRSPDRGSRGTKGPHSVR